MKLPEIPYKMEAEIVVVVVVPQRHYYHHQKISQKNFPLVLKEEPLFGMLVLSPFCSAAMADITFTDIFSLCWEAKPNLFPHQQIFRNKI